MSQSITIIGIDPGSRNTGWGVVREVSGVLQLVDCGVIRPPLDGEFASRLGVIFKEIHRVLGRLKPDEASVEQVFTAKNAATALKLGQARGAAIAACAAYDGSVGLRTHGDRKMLWASAGPTRSRSVSWSDGCSA